MSKNINRIHKHTCTHKKTKRWLTDKAEKHPAEVGGGQRRREKSRKSTSNLTDFEDLFYFLKTIVFIYLFVF